MIKRLAKKLLLKLLDDPEVRVKIDNIVQEAIKPEYREITSSVIEEVLRRSEQGEYVINSDGIKPNFIEIEAN